MTRHLAVAVALALVSQPALAKGTHGGGGGHSGGGSHSGGGGHGGGGGQGRSAGSSGGSHSYSHGGHSSASLAGSSYGHLSGYRSGWTSSRSGLGLAERRHPGAGTGRGRYPYRYPYNRGYYGGYYGSPFYGSFYFGWPYYYEPFYDPFYYGVSVPAYYPPSLGLGYRYEDPGPEMADEASPDRGRYDDRGREPAAEDADSGELLVRAWPRDATIYVDGQFQGTARDVTLLHLRPGRHTIEVVRPGFRPEEREVEISRGETRQLAVTLRRP
jgi:hypothetical protein